MGLLHVVPPACVDYVVGRYYWWTAPTQSKLHAVAVLQAVWGGVGRACQTAYACGLVLDGVSPRQRVSAATHQVLITKPWGHTAYHGGGALRSVLSSVLQAVLCCSGLLFVSWALRLSLQLWSGVVCCAVSL
jgi:hypothetical protein